MDPTDPTWQVPSGPASDEGGTPPREADPSEGVEFVDFAETEPVEPVTRETPGSSGLLWLLLLPLGFTFLLTMLFLAMRGVMEEGGMVARGGPYEIAHPAPDYWWIFPVSIIGCIVIAFLSMGMFSFGSSRRRTAVSPFTGSGMLSEEREINLVALFFWPAIFLSLGWNFCEYGFFGGEGLVWGWVVCGVLFVLMGGLPLYFVMRKVSGSELLGVVKSNSRSLWPQFLGVAAGIPLGILFFSVVS